jgi:hypothetical protein
MKKVFLSPIVLVTISDSTLGIHKRRAARRSEGEKSSLSRQEISLVRGKGDLVFIKTDSLGRRNCPSVCFALDAMKFATLSPGHHNDNDNDASSIYYSTHIQ